MTLIDLNASNNLIIYLKVSISFKFFYFLPINIKKNSLWLSTILSMIGVTFFRLPKSSS